MRRFRQAVRLLRRGGAAGMLWVLIAAAPAGANERFRIEDVPLGAEAVQALPGRWEGHPAVSAFTGERAGRDGQPGLGPAVHVLVLDAEGWRAIGSWPLPPRTRWVEPMTLPGYPGAWLLLVGTQWQVAVPDGDTLSARPICPCDTIFTHGGGPDTKDHRFVHDLNGDGVSEVVLPYSGHIEAYRIVPQALAAEPLWRTRWNAESTPLPRTESAGQGFELPPFRFRDVDGDGVPELLVESQAALYVSDLPPVASAGDYALDGPRQALLQRLPSQQALPATLLESARRLRNRRFSSADALLQALFAPATQEQQAEWAPALLQVLSLARSAVPVAVPYAVPLSGLGSFGSEDRGLLLGLTDMDGDRVLDALHAKLLNYGSALSQKNELRWYRGVLKEGRLAFAPPADAVKTDAGSFAELVEPRSDGSPPLALLLATTEVTFGSIMRALTSKSVSLEARVIPWQPGRLDTKGVPAQKITFRELEGSDRRPMFLFADLNGDGWRDYLLNPNPTELRVHLSAGEAPRLIQASHVQQGLPLPSKPERVLVTDLDDDGREELVLRYREKYHGPLGLGLRLVRLVTD